MSAGLSSYKTLQPFCTPSLVSNAQLVQVRIAALKREEDSLSKERERLEAEKEAHIRFAATPSTDLGQPLAILRGLA